MPLKILEIYVFMLMIQASRCSSTRRSGPFPPLPTHQTCTSSTCPWWSSHAAWPAPCCSPASQQQVRPYTIITKMASSFKSLLTLMLADGSGLYDLYHGAKNPDLKPLYGAMFRDHLLHYTHWGLIIYFNSNDRLSYQFATILTGWIDIDSFFGDFTPLLQALKQFDVVTYPDGVCHSASSCA